MLTRVFEMAGFRLERGTSSHLVYSKEGVLRPVIIPKYKNITVAIIRGLLRTAGMTREEYFRYLNKA